MDCTTTAKYFTMGSAEHCLKCKIRQDVKECHFSVGSNWETSHQNFRITVSDRDFVVRQRNMPYTLLELTYDMQAVINITKEIQQ